MAVGTTIKTIQDIMRKDAGVDGDAQRISQLGWMLFLKIFDDKEKEYELMRKGYRSPMPERLRWRTWAADPEGITGNVLLKFIDSDLFSTLKELPAEAGSNGSGILVRKVFEDSYNYMKNGTLIRQVANKINEIDFNRTEDRHLFGEIYEKILKDLQSAGNAGEYYTPRAVTQFMVDQVDPKLGESILDPACGTGGFLACAIENIRKTVKTIEEEDLLQSSIHGVEKKPMPHLLCVTNMMLHGIDVPNQIKHDNTLARPLKDYSARDRVDVIVTNPPFGGMEEDGIESNFPATYQTRETADLFLILIMHLLKDGGRAAIVLPDGTLFGEGVKSRIKERLLKECNLHTIIRLPKNVFAPYTNINTNLLFFEKGKPTKEIWYYEHTYPEGYKSYNKTKPIRIEEFEPVKAWWTNRTETNHAWRVPMEQVIANGYNLDIKNPNVVPDELGDPVELLREYEKNQLSIVELHQSLKSELIDAMIRNDCKMDANLDFFFQHFDLLVIYPKDVDRLRDLLLKLAVRGQLRTNECGDEPACKLFERIKRERELLVNGGKAKNEKPLDPINNNEIPFQIPKNWIWTRYGNIGQIVGGGTPQTANADYYSSKGIPWLTPADLYRYKEKFIGRGKKDISELGLRESSAQLLPKGSIIFSSRAPIGYVAIASNPLSTNQGFKSCIPHILEMSEYIYYFLLSSAMEIDAAASGTTFKEVSGKDVKQIPFPLPPLAEQRRIVLKVENLLKKCSKLENHLKRSHALQNKFADVSVQNLIHK